MRVEQVFMTPLASAGTYGTEVEVSDFVKIGGLSKIKRSIDSTNYSLGVYRFNDLKLKCENALGTFNENDSRSIFSFTRDSNNVRTLYPFPSIFPVTHAVYRYPFRYLPLPFPLPSVTLSVTFRYPFRDRPRGVVMICRG